MDLNSTIIPKSDQLNSDDLISGPRTITITRVAASPDSPEQPVSIYFEGDGGKPFKPCKSMRRVLVAAWGPDASTFVGRSLTLYRDPKVKFGGLEVGGTRISHMTHIERDMVLALTETRAKRTPFQVRKLVEPQKPAAPAVEPDRKLVAEARAFATGGTEEFRAWWKDNPQHRAALSSVLGDLQEVCRQADTIKAEAAADPFGAPALPAGYDPDAIAREAFAKSDAVVAAMEDEE